MTQMLIFGMGYTANHIADRLRARGWDVVGTSRTPTENQIDFHDQTAVLRAMADSSHILSTVPPDGDSKGDGDGDPVLARYHDALSLTPARWVGYLSSTGVYGDSGGAWVDESAPIKGRRPARNAADGAWQALRPDVRVFRLPGIYGPGRSILDRLRQGRAHRIAMPGQVFSRIHVDDIASALIASFRAPADIFNLADDFPCPQNHLVEYGAALLGMDVPPMQGLEQANLSPAALAFYAENRRVANGRAKRLLGWRPRYADYRSGLTACHQGLK